MTDRNTLLMLRLLPSISCASNPSTTRPTNSNNNNKEKKVLIRSLTCMVALGVYEREGRLLKKNEIRVGAEFFEKSDFYGRGLPAAARDCAEELQATEPRRAKGGERGSRVRSEI